MTDSSLREAGYLFTDVRGMLLQLSKLIPATMSIADLPMHPISTAGVAGWQEQGAPELVISPDPSWSCEDPFLKDRTLIFGSGRHPGASSDYSIDSRATLRRLEEWLRKEHLFDEVRVGPELEFHLLRGIRYNTSPTENFAFILEEDGISNNSIEFENGHRAGHHTMHLAPSPIDRFHEIRRCIVEKLLQVGITPTHHLHESGRSQQEIGVEYRSPLRAADEIQLQKYVIRKVAELHSLSATFMPKPMSYASGNGLHLNFSLWRDGKNIFFSDSNKISVQAAKFATGILKHIKALNALTNPSTNSYRRLNSLYDQKKPVGFGFQDRAVAIRVPAFSTQEDCRIEIRFPDPSCNPYLAISALICAGIEGMEKNEYLDPVSSNHHEGSHFFEAQNKSSESMAFDLREAVVSLHGDRNFLEKNSVFHPSMLDAVIRDENYFCHVDSIVVSPFEYACYFSL